MFYGVNGDFAYKYELPDHTIGVTIMEPCILVCQKRTLPLQINGGALDVEELMKIQTQLNV